MSKLSDEQAVEIGRLIDYCDHAADAQRRIAHAFRSGVISKGPRTLSGDLHPNSSAAIDRHRNIAAELEQMRDALFDFRNGKIDHL